MIPELIAKGYVTYPWIRATIQSLIPEVAKFLKLKVERGAMIAEVVKGGPADKAGLKGGKPEGSGWEYDCDRRRGYRGEGGSTRCKDQ